MNRASGKISGFKDLPVGWHFGQGKPPSSAVLGIANAWVGTFIILGFDEMDAFPGIDGEIMVTAYEDKHCIEITVDADGLCRFVYEFAGKEQQYKDGLELSAVMDCLRVVVEGREREKCNMSELSTSSTITTEIESVSWISLSDQTKMPMESVRFPALNETAPSPRAVPFVRTSSSFIGTLQQSRQFSGPSTNERFRPIAA